MSCLTSSATWWNCKLWTSIFAFYLLLLATTTATSRDVECGKQLKMSCFGNNVKDRKAIMDRKLVWLKDGEKIKYSKRVISKKRDSVLKIKNAMSEDIGIYACFDVTDGRPGVELAAYNVSLINDREGIKENDNQLQFANTWLMNLQKYIIFPSIDYLTLNCRAIGTGPIQYRWYKNNKRLLTRIVDSALKTDKAELKLKDLVPSDSAVYTCVAKNNYGSISYNFTLSVQEITRTAPYLEKVEFKNRTAMIGQNVSLPCFELICGTLPEFRWFKWKTTPNNTVFDMVAMGAQNTEKSSKDTLQMMKADQYKQVSKQSHRSYSRNLLYGVELLLRNVAGSDQGFYTCVASNHIGYDYMTMYLTIKSAK